MGSDTKNNENGHTICSVLKGMRDQNTDAMKISFISKVPVHQDMNTGKSLSFKEEEVEVIVRRKDV